MNEIVVSKGTAFYIVLYLLFLLVVNQGNSCFSQQPIYTHEQHFGIEDGLPQSFITGFTQDKDGFIWISTLDGLSRFDGRAFKNFRNKPGDATTLAQNVIYKIFPQTDSSKLTVIYEGLHHDRFDTRTFKANRISHLSTLYRIPNAKAQFINRANIYNGTDWLFPLSDTRGIGWRNTNTGKTFFANTANCLLKQDTLSVIFQAADGTAYLISEDGVQVSDKAKNSLHSFDSTRSYKGSSLKCSLMETSTRALLRSCRKIDYWFTEIVRRSFLTLQKGLPNPLQSHMDQRFIMIVIMIYFVRIRRGLFILLTKVGFSG